MEFDFGKCKKMEFGRSNRRCTYNYKMKNEIINKTSEEKDLGVIFTEDLSPEHHINKIISKTLSLLRNIRKSFTYLDKEMMRKIITSMIRLRLEYAAVIWSPHQMKAGMCAESSNEDDTRIARFAL